METNSFDQKVESLEGQLGFKLRSYQLLALKALSQGRNVILHAPTGGGKTVLLQGASSVTPHTGLTVILYPLRALVKDQTSRFAALGFPSVALYGETPLKERGDIYNRLLNGSAKILLTTPESFDMNRKLQEVLTQRGVAVLIIDEAHAYEEWADGFRPTYRRAGSIAERVGVRQFMLCSATLTQKGFNTAKDTIKRSDWTIVKVPPVRTNLIYKNLSEPADEILSRAVRGNGLQGPGIVFFTTVRCLEDTRGRIERDTNKKVLRYHGSLGAAERRRAQDEFMSGDRWIFATKAFGMGIDKNNIRNIIHYQLPSSVLSYAQETGRAGRDGEDSTCYLTQSENGEAAHFLLDMSLPSVERVRQLWNILQGIALHWPGWFEVDWEEVSRTTRMQIPALQACLGWLFTGKMIEKKQKQLDWKITISSESDELAVKYKRKTPDILDLLRAEAMVEQGPAEFYLSPDVMAESIGSMFSNWRAKLRKMAELGILKIEEPAAGRSRYRFLHNSFSFAQGEEQLKKARSSAFARLKAMQALQNADPKHRRKIIEDAISLKMAPGNGVEVLGGGNIEPPVFIKKASAPPAVPPAPTITALPYDEDDDDFVVPF